MKRMLSLATVAFLVAATTWAEDNYAHIPNIYWTQSNAIGNYLGGIPTNGSTNFPSIAEEWETSGNGGPVDFTGFFDNLAMVLAVHESTPTLFQQDVGIFGLVPVGQNMTDEQAAIVANDFSQTLGLPLATVEAAVTKARQDTADGQYTLAEAAEGLEGLRRLVGGGAGAQTLEEMVSAARLALGGFGFGSLPVALALRMMQMDLAGGLHPYHHSVRGGVHAWMQDGELDDEDHRTLGLMPHVESENDGLMWTLGVPLTYGDFARMEDDDCLAGGIEGTVQQTLDNGIFFGLRAAGLQHYVKGLPGNEFLSLSAGPFAGTSVELADGLVATGMGLLEGISTEFEDDTAYVAGGLGLSYMATENVALHAFGIYCNNLDGYGDEDRDFFDVGGRVEVGLGGTTAVSASVSTILESDDSQSVTVSISLTREF